MKRFFRNQDGAAITEFAIALPLLVLMLLGSVDIARLVLAHHKMLRLASQTGDLVAQSDDITEGEIANIFSAVEYVAYPFDFEESGQVILTSITESEGVARINWQRLGGGSLAVTSKFGSLPGQPATLPEDLLLNPNSTLIVSEVYFAHEPILSGGVVEPFTIYHRAYFRPRLGALKVVDQ